MCKEFFLTLTALNDFVKSVFPGLMTVTPTLGKLREDCDNLRQNGLYSKFRIATTVQDS